MPEIDPLDPSNCLNQKVVELEAGGSHTFKERSEDMGSWQVINCYQRHHHHDKHHHHHHHGQPVGGQIFYSRSLKGARRELFFPKIKQSIS